MKNRKAFTGIIAVIAILIAGIVISGSRIAIWAAKRGIENTLAGSSVSIGGSRIDPGKEIVLSDVHIKDQGSLKVSVKNVVIRYSIPAVFAGSVEMIEIDGVNVTIDLTKGAPPKLRTASPGFFHVRDISISGAHIAVVDRDLSLKGTLAVRYSVNDNKIGYIDLAIGSFKSQNVVVEGARLAGPLSGAGAKLSVNKISSGNAVINDLNGTAMLLGNGDLIVDPFDCRVFDGSVRGNVKTGMDQAHEYSIAMTCKGLDLETFMRDFKLEERVRLTGRVKGDISLKGAGLKITDLNGSLSAEETGGVLIIKDPAILENIARSTKEPVEILMESLKNYEYTIGTMKLASEGSDLALDVTLNGKTGKRVFYVVLHDIIAMKGGVL